MAARAPIRIAAAALPLAVAALLGAAAFFKAASPRGAQALLESALGEVGVGAVPAWGVLAVCVAELALAIALVLPATRRPAMGAAAGFFAVSIGVLLLAQARGHVRSCGCFGRFSPTVRTTVVIDGVLLAGVGAWFMLFNGGKVRHEVASESDHR